MGLETPVNKEGLILSFPMTSNTYELNGETLSAQYLYLGMFSLQFILKFVNCPA
jgi:hypothetical protein